MYLEYPTQVFTGHTGRLSDVGFLPDQRSIYTVGAPDVGTIQFWDLASGAVTRSFDVPVGCAEVDISADGQVMAAICGDIYLWRLATGEEIRQIPNPVSDNARVRFSPDSRHLMTGGVDMPAKLWDVETGALIRTFETEDPSAAPGLGMAFTPDGRQVVIGGQDGGVRLWDVATGALLREFHGHTDWVWGVAVSPDGRYVASAGFDPNGVRLWDLQTGDLVRRFPHPNVVSYALEFSADGRYLLTGGWDATARLWNVESGVEVRRFSQPQVTFAVALSADGRYLLTGSWDTVARLWDLDPPQGLMRFASVTPPAYGVLSPDGGRLALAGGDGLVSIVSAESGEPQSQVTGHAAGVYDIDFSPDGRYVATTSSADGVTRVSDLTTGTMLWEDHVSGGQSVQFSKDGLSLLVIGHDNAVWILRALTGEVLQRFWDAERLLFGVYSPGNETIAASLCCSPRVLVWDVGSGQVSHTLTPSAVTRALVYSADGRYLATGGDGGTIHLWDAATGAEVRRFVGHGNTVERALAFSHDGRYIASGGYDRTARIWEVATGEQIRQFSGFTDGILSVAFTPDDSRLLIVSIDGAVQLTYAQLQDAIADLCGRLIGDLDEATRARYAITDPGPTCARTAEP